MSIQCSMAHIAHLVLMVDKNFLLGTVLALPFQSPEGNMIVLKSNHI